MRRLLSITVLILTIGVGGFINGNVRAAADSQISSDKLAAIRQMLTAPDNGVFFELWSVDDIVQACIELYYNDPPTAEYHNRVVNGAVILLGETGDPRAVPVLIDAINTHGPQALYALGNFPTVEALNALVDNVRNDDPSNRENAAEGLRRMQAPSDGIPDGWVQALENAVEKVGEWVPLEPDASLIDYFADAHTNVKKLLEQARAVQGE